MEISFPTGLLMAGLRKLIIGKAETRRRRFEELHQGLFDDFLKAHRDYISMFGGLRSELIRAVADPTQAAQLVQSIHASFGAQRQELEGLRMQLRALSDQVIKASSDPFEKRFVVAILCYLLGHEFPHKRPSDLDSQATLLEELGHDGVLSSASSYILKTLSTESDPSKLSAAVTQEMDRLSGYLSDVCNAFASLKFDVYR